MYPAWLKSLPELPAPGLSSPVEQAASELHLAFPGETFVTDLQPEMGESFEVLSDSDGVRILGGSSGILYGAYALILRRAAGEKIPARFTSAPRYALRMIDGWDNPDGSVERGYAGRSLFFDRNRFSYDPDRLRQLARLMASVGINTLCVNNVNVHEPAQELLDQWLPELSALAALFRPFGIRLMISVDFSQPIRHGLPTADPLDPAVQQWWIDTADKVYTHVPDLAGFLVKADSEGRPGPYAYGRNHAEGANLLARALKPHGGTLVWRCFVYNCRQKWWDTKTDRACAAYENYAGLDGAFDDNVILQIKYGPFDFQVREPLSPLFLAMPKTNLAIEFQLAQEYTGQQIDIFTMLPLWRELMEDLPEENLHACAAVSNFGRDENFAGHPFALLNLFSFGIFAWSPVCSAAEVADVVKTWVRLTYGFNGENETALTDLLLSSRDTYEKYTATLGLGWMITPHTHYGPNPDGYEYDSWGTYHRADRNAVGVDRTAKGTGYLDQYPESIRHRYEDPATCPDLYKLFFHRLPYDYPMSDGRTLIQRIYDDHFEGAEETKIIRDTLSRLPFPEPDSGVILARMDRQVANAESWRDIVNTFFFRFCGIPDAHGREIHA